MKKILVLGILTLSALSFGAETTTPVMQHGNMQHGNMQSGDMKMMKDGKCTMMTPEMMKMMQDNGMMKDGKMMNHQGMMNNGTATPVKK